MILYDQLKLIIIIFDAHILTITIVFDLTTIIRHLMIFILYKMQHRHSMQFKTC